MLTPTKHFFQNLLGRNVSKIHRANNLKKRVEEKDDDKRAFLKIAGLLGLGAFVYALIPKKAQALVFGGRDFTSKVSLKNNTNGQVDPAKNLTLYQTKKSFDDIKVRTVDNVNNTANILTNVVTIPALGSASPDSSMPIVIAGNQDIVPVKGYGKFETKNLVATDNDSLWYLRKINRQLQSLNTVDGARRQRIVIDASDDMQMSTSGAQTSTAGYGVQMFQDIARNDFANGIRKKLIFN